MMGAPDRARPLPPGADIDFERLIETWRGPLVGLVAGWGAPWTDAAELAQDALVEAYLGADRLRGDATDPAVMGPWLRGIARHLFVGWRRRRTRRREEPLADLEPAAPGRFEHAGDARAEELARALERLPEKHRVVLYLRYLEDSGVREIAALLGLPESTVEGRLYRARRALRDHLESGARAHGAKESRT